MRTRVVAWASALLIALTVLVTLLDLREHAAAGWLAGLPEVNVPAIPLWGALLLGLVLGVSLIWLERRGKPSTYALLLAAFSTKQFFASVVQEIRRKLPDEHQLVLNIGAVDYDRDEQRAQLERLVAQRRHHKGAVVIPIEPKASAAELQAFAERFKKPLVFFDTEPGLRTLPENCAFVGCDNEAGGREAAKAVAFELNALQTQGGFRVLVIGSEFQPDRQRGFEDELPKHLAAEVTIECDESGRHLREDGERIARHWLKDGTFHGVFCTNDEMALGVLDFLRGGSLEKPPVVVGYDAIPTARELIDSGKSALRNTVLQEIGPLAGEAVKALESLASRSYRRATEAEALQDSP